MKSSIAPMPPPSVIVQATNGIIQVSRAPGESTIGLLVEREGLWAGVLLSTEQAETLAGLLARRARSPSSPLSLRAPLVARDISVSVLGRPFALPLPALCASLARLQLSTEGYVSREDYALAVGFLLSALATGYSPDGATLLLSAVDGADGKRG